MIEERKLWDVWRPEDGETRGTGGRFYAYSPDAAAKFYAEDLDDEAGRVTEEVRICVAEVGKEETHTFTVTGEMIAHYNVEEV